MSGLASPDSKPAEVDPKDPDDQVALEIASIVRFMREDPDHLVFRRFERLNLYNLLSLQHRLTAYDKEISLYEKEWNGPALAQVLPELESLMKSYNDAFLAQCQMSKVKSAERYLVAALRQHAVDSLKPLKHELDPEDGWSELKSVVCAEKGWIHRRIDDHTSLSKLFRKVSNPPSSPFPATTSIDGVGEPVTRDHRHADCYVNSAPLSPETTNMCRVFTLTPREPSGSWSEPSSMPPFVSLFLLLYLPFHSSPVQSESYFWCSHASCWRRSFHRSFPTRHRIAT